MPKNPLNSSEYRDIPAIPAGLVEALERRFPSRCPQISDSERVIFKYAGKVELIQWLKDIQSKRINHFVADAKETIQHV